MKLFTLLMAGALKEIKIIFLTGSISWICFYIMYSIKSKTLQSCYQYSWERNVTDRNDLKKILDVCFKNGIKANRKTEQNDYFKPVLNLSNCYRPLRYLSVAKPLIALASFPGSGNTWTRVLIETATGIYTGSIYNKETEFEGSKMCPARGKVHIVKTHRTDNSTYINKDCMRMNITHLNFSSVIFIVRNPFDAILSEFNRQYQKRHRDGNETSFPRSAWKVFVARYAYKWRHMALYWLKINDVPVYMLVYEKLVKNVSLEIFKLMKFLRYEIPYKYKHCLSSNKTKTFKRNKPKWMSKKRMYGNELRERVNSVIKDVENQLYSNWNISSLLDTYILPVTR